MKAQRKPNDFTLGVDPVLEPVATWESKADDLEEARQIVRELNLHGPRNVRAFDDVA